MTTSNQPMECPSGEHWVRAYERRRIINGKETISRVKAHCRINPGHFKKLAQEENLDLDILYYALTVYGEARGENDKSRYTIAWIIRNRVKKSNGKNYQEIVTRPSQFSCWLSTDTNYRDLKNPGKKNFIEKQAWERIKVIVKEVNDAPEEKNPVPGITNYFSGEAHKSWQKVYFDLPDIPNFHFVRKQ